MPSAKQTKTFNQIAKFLRSQHKQPLDKDEIFTGKGK